MFYIIINTRFFCEFSAFINASAIGFNNFQLVNTSQSITSASVFCRALLFVCVVNVVQTLPINLHH